MSAALKERLVTALASREAKSTLRRLTHDSPPPAILSSLPNADRPLVDFSSNDYLSLSQSSELRNHFLRSLSSAPHILGSTGSRLLDGDTHSHSTLESRLASFYNAPSALLFSSGFDANAGLFSCIPAADDLVLYDEYVHASVHDGMRASRVPAKRRRAFRHNDLDHLRNALQRAVEEEPEVRSGRSVFVAVEGVYSMDGDVAPLREIADLLEELLPAGNGHLIVDEAHSTGIYGPLGRGLVAHLGLEDRVFLRLNTFGKALCSNGAVVLCEPHVRSYLINYARPLIYSTAPSHSNIIALSCVHDLLSEGYTVPLSRNLLSHATHLRALLSTYLPHPLLALAPPPALPTPILPLLTPRPRQLARFLVERGFLVRPIAAPTVPKGMERVRVCLHAANTTEEIEGLARAVGEWLRVIGEEEEGRLAKL